MACGRRRCAGDRFECILLQRRNRARSGDGREFGEYPAVAQRESASQLLIRPSGPAGEAADTLTAFGQTGRGERFTVAEPGFDFTTRQVKNLVYFYDDAAKTQISDLVTRSTDFKGRELFTVVSDVPEPSTWEMMLVGVLGLGAMLRRAGPRRFARPQALAAHCRRRAARKATASIAPQNAATPAHQY